MVNQYIFADVKSRRTYPENEEEAVKQKFEPDEPEPDTAEQEHNLDGPLEPEDRSYKDGSGEGSKDGASVWQKHDYEGASSNEVAESEDEPNPWGTPRKGRT